MSEFSWFSLPTNLPRDYGGRGVAGVGYRGGAWHGAWYGHPGARLAAGAAVGAVGAAAAYGAYAAPYYRPACGYYPYPPCY